MGVDDIADRTAFEGVKVFRERWSKNPTAWKVQIMRAKKKAFWKKRNSKQSIRVETSNGK